MSDSNYSFHLTLTPVKSSEVTQAVKGMAAFALRLVDTNNDDTVACEVLLPKYLCLGKRDLPTADMRERMTSWLALRLLEEDKREVRELVEHAWSCTSLVGNQLVNGGLKVRINQSWRVRSNSWAFEWSDTHSIQEWAKLAGAEHRAQRLDDSLPKPLPRKGPSGRF